MNEEARNVLAEYVAARTPDAAKQGAAWDAINERVAGGDMGPNLPEEPAAASGGSSLLAKGFVVGIVAAGLLYAGTELLSEPEQEPVTVSPLPEKPLEGPEVVDAPEPRPEQVENPIETTAAPDDAHEQSKDPGAGSPQPKGRKPKAQARGQTPRAPEPAGSTLAAEMALLAKGQRALKRGDPKRALRLFDQHVREYPRGELSDERRVQRAQALCDLGRVSQARHEADQFARERGNSPLVGKASRICKETAE